MDNLQASVELGTIGVQATQGLADGAAEVYARLRVLEKDEASSSGAVAEVAALTASVPMLPIPQHQAVAQVAATQDKTDGLESVAKKKGDPVALAAVMNAMVADVAKKWADSTHERVRQEEDLRNSPAYRAQEDYLRHVKTADHPTHFSNPYTASSVFVVGTASMGYVAALNTSNQSTIAYNAISDSMQQITPLMPGSGDMRAELGLIGALFANGAMQQAVWLTVGGAEKSEGRSLDMQYAMAYSGRLIACCEDPAFNTYLMSLVTHHMEGSEPATPEQMKSLVSMVKIGMLLSALALFYQPEKGAQVGSQVGALLKPDAEKLAKDDPRAALINQIKGYLDALRSTNPVLCEQVLNNIMAFIDSNRSNKSLTDPAKILLAVFTESEGTAVSRQIHASTKG